MRVDDAGRIVIIGGGHAGGQLCAALAAEGLGPRVHLVCEEPELPYQRPPLSKTYLKNPQETVQLHRPEPWYAEAGITLYRADPTAPSSGRVEWCGFAPAGNSATAGWYSPPAPGRGGYRICLMGFPT
jgi:glycine/D-amino acid oxidase-like deaminating enzyme